MIRSGLAGRLLGPAALAVVVGSGLPAAAAPPAGDRPEGCIQPEVSHAHAAGGRTARGGRGADHQALSAGRRAEIAARTARILADKNASLDRRTSRRVPGSIPVYVHVMMAQDGTGNVTGARVSRQIEVLNAAFSGAESPGVAADTGFRFVLADIERHVDNAWHRDRQSAAYRAKTRRGGVGALNVWLVGFRDLGVATFPWEYAGGPRVDGVRVHYDSLPGRGLNNYDLGKTLVHEAGHWLGLYHTFQAGCTELNDEVADTTAQSGPTHGCPVGSDTCGLPGLDPVNNYMDYSYDACYSAFTPGQAQRMQEMAVAYRS
jgi:Pregnancy-associated plasma protein-A